MNKREVLKLKLELLICEIEKAKTLVGKEHTDYLNSYKKWVESVLSKLETDNLPYSNGGLIGTGRAISEYANLSDIKSLYNAAYDVDIYYCKEFNE